MQPICLPQKRTHEQRRGKEGGKERGQKEASTPPQLPISNPGAPVGTEYVRTYPCTALYVRLTNGAMELKPVVLVLAQRLSHDTVLCWVWSSTGSP